MHISVSVIMPTYNSAAFLANAVRSVEAQQWENLEIVAVDDGSTDDTVAVLKKMADNYNIRVLTQPNQGPASARNTGIRAATGRWVAFLDSDDVWLDGKLQAQFAEIKRNAEARFSFGDATFRYPNGREEIVAHHVLELPLVHELLKGNILHTSSMVVRRDALDEVGLFNTDMRIGEDWDLWLRLASRYQAAPVLRPLVIYRKIPYLEKYKLETLEQCVSMTMTRFFDREENMVRWPELRPLERKIRAWHTVVLAKSYLRHGRVLDFLRLSATALRTHPAALRYFSTRGLLIGPW